MRASIVCLCTLAGFVSMGLVRGALDTEAQKPASSVLPAMPRTWDETALEDWATPVAGLNVRCKCVAVRLQMLDTTHARGVY